VSRNQAIRLPLNKRLIEGLEPSDARYYIHDSRQPALTLAVHPSGERSFVFLPKFQGRARRLTIGNFPATTVEGARDKVKQYLAAIARGDDPFEAKAEERKRATVGELWQKYLDYARAHCKPATWKKYETLYGYHLAKRKNKPAATLTKADVSSWHVRIAEARTRKRKTDENQRAVYQANRCLALLRMTHEQRRPVRIHPDARGHRSRSRQDSVPLGRVRNGDSPNWVESLATGNCITMDAARGCEPGVAG
jgi:hypothetical protein